jgi:hypothetical protein
MGATFGWVEGLSGPHSPLATTSVAAAGMRAAGRVRAKLAVGAQLINRADRRDAARRFNQPVLGVTFPPAIAYNTLILFLPIEAAASRWRAYPPSTSSKGSVRLRRRGRS